MTTNLISDLSTISFYPKLALDKLVEKSDWIICHDVAESLSSGQHITEIDIGIGTLLISVSEEEVGYKFIPSSKLENGVKVTARTGKSPLIKNTEDAISSRAIRTYKDIFQ